MRILGVDCGSRITGYGIIESDGRSHRALAYGAIRMSQRQAFEQRLAKVADGLDAVVGRYKPEEAAVEDVFAHKNMRSALALAHVRGVALLSASRAGLRVATYSPSKIKASVVSHGAAGKQQVRMMVKLLLGVQEELDPLDISDALAVAYCHASLRGS